MPKPKTALKLDRIVEAAMSVADTSGVAGLTMRSVAKRLDVTPMSLYRYVANKDALLDAMVDAVFATIHVPAPEGAWRQEIANHAGAVRAALLDHPWSLGVMETRTNPGPATLGRHDAVIATFRAAGFSIPLTAKAFVTLDSFIYGFVLQETSLPFDPNEDEHETIQAVATASPPDEFPHLTELVAEHFVSPSYKFGDQFDFGLDLVLEGLSRLLVD